MKEKMMKRESVVRTHSIAWMLAGTLAAWGTVSCSDSGGSGPGSMGETGDGEPSKPAPVDPVDAMYLGVHEHLSFSETSGPQDFWTYGDILYTAPEGQVSQETANRWIAWYFRADELYRIVSGRPNFDDYYRYNTQWGDKKIIAVAAETCGVGCGNKRKAETDQGILDMMLEDPDDYLYHWVLFYEMGRGGSPEPWVSRATWPSNTEILPHLMAGLIYYEIGGGEDGIRDLHTPGELLAELESWEQADIEYVDHFVAADEQTVETANGKYTSHHLIPGMLWKIRMATDVETIGMITANMATKPSSTSATQAMCNFRSAVNDATDGNFDAQMIGPWGLPHDC